MPEPIVFISSSRADAAFSGRLTAALERAGATVTHGPGEFVGAGLSPAAEQALTDANACVVLLSAPALASERVEGEAARFHELRSTQPQRLLVPVLLAGAEPSAVWPFLLGYPPLSASTAGASRGDEALIAEVLRRLDPLLQVDTVVMPAVPVLPPGGVPAGLDLAQAPRAPVTGRNDDIANAGTAILPAAGAFEGIAAAGDVHAGRSAEWSPDNRRNGILILAGGLLALTLCVALSIGFLARGSDSGEHPGQSPLGVATSTFTTEATPPAAPTASATHAPTATASPHPTATTTTGAPTATATPVTHPGLWGDYYTSTRADPGTPPPTYPAQITRICHEIDSNVNYPSRNTFGCPQLTNSPSNTSGYAVRWYGYITVPTTGTYTFYTYSDDGIGVIVNGQRLIYDWSVHWPTWDCSTNSNPMPGPTPAPTPNPSGCSTISLKAGQLYPIELDYYENDQGGATIQLCWQAADLQHNIVPPSAFSH